MGLNETKGGRQAQGPGGLGPEGGDWVVPTALEPGARVSVVAPSGPFCRDRFEAGVDLLRGMGLQPVFDAGLFASYHGYLAGDDARRLGAVQAALADPSTGAIWVARGGYGATRLLPALEPARVREAGKWLVGFSDATALHALWARAGVMSVHGPNVTTLCSWSGDARLRLWECLNGKRSTQLTGQTWAGSGQRQGWLAGGNLTVLASMAGTGQLPNWSGAVVVLEDVAERPYRLDRSLTQLLQCGAFDGVVAVAVGQLTDCYQRDRGETLSDAVAAVTRALLPLAIPVVGGLSVGHEASSEAVILGRRVRVDANPGRGCIGGVTPAPNRVP